MPSYYEILGVQTNASVSEIKSRYYKLSLKCHPDKTLGDYHLQQNLNIAYSVLSDPNTRVQYDLSLSTQSPFVATTKLAPKSRIIQPDCYGEFQKLENMLLNKEQNLEDLIFEMHRLWHHYLVEIGRVEDALPKLVRIESADLDYIKKVVRDLRHESQSVLSLVIQYEKTQSSMLTKELIEHFAILECHLKRARVCLQEKKQFFNIVALCNNQTTYVRNLPHYELAKLSDNISRVGYFCYDMWTKTFLNYLGVYFANSTGTNARVRARKLAEQIDPLLEQNQQSSFIETNEQAITHANSLCVASISLFALVNIFNVDAKSILSTNNLISQSFTIDHANDDQVWRFLLAATILKRQGNTSISVNEVLFVSQRFIREICRWDNDKSYLPREKMTTPVLTDTSSTNSGVAGEFESEASADEIDFGEIMQLFMTANLNDLYLELVLVSVEKNLLALPNLDGLKNTYRMLFDSQDGFNICQRVSNKTWAKLHLLYLQVAGKTLSPKNLFVDREKTFGAMIATSNNHQLIVSCSEASAPLSLVKLQNYQQQLREEKEKWYASRAQKELKDHKLHAAETLERLLKSNFPAQDAFKLVCEWYPRFNEGLLRSRATEILATVK